MGQTYMQSYILVSYREFMRPEIFAKTQLLREVYIHDLFSAECNGNDMFGYYSKEDIATFMDVVRDKSMNDEKLFEAHIKILDPETNFIEKALNGYGCPDTVLLEINPTANKLYYMNFSPRDRATRSYHIYDYETLVDEIISLDIEYLLNGYIWGIIFDFSNPGLIKIHKDLIRFIVGLFPEFTNNRTTKLICSFGYVCEPLLKNWRRHRRAIINKFKSVINDYEQIVASLFNNYIERRGYTLHIIPLIRPNYGKLADLIMTRAKDISGISNLPIELVDKITKYF